MTLCGVLKDILLVAASIAIWGTPISGLQYFGYSIALCGLVYYKLGGAQIKAQLSDMNRAWAEHGAKHPALRKLIVFAVILGLFFTIMIGLGPSVGYDTEYLQKVIKEGKGSTGDTSN